MTYNNCVSYLSHFGNLCRLQGKSQIVQDELVKLGESMVSSAEGTRALALELCREFEEKFLRHITGGEVKDFHYRGGNCIPWLACLRVYYVYRHYHVVSLGI